MDSGLSPNLEVTALAVMLTMVATRDRRAHSFEVLIGWLKSWSLTYEVPPYTLSPDLHRPTECSTAVHPCGYCSAGQNALDFVILKVMLQRLDAHALGLK